MWREASPKVKAPFEKKAASAKKKYTAARAKYVKSSHYKKYMSEKKEHQKTFKSMKKVKKPKNWPKRSMSGYFLYLNKNRKKFVKKLAKQGITGREAVIATSKMGGEGWGKMSDKEKKPFMKQAASDKKAYEKKMKKFKKTPAYKNYMQAKKDAKKASKM